MRRRRKIKCRRSGKIGYLNKWDAEAKARSAADWHEVGMRVYRCPDCRYWHTSRKRVA